MSAGGASPGAVPAPAAEDEARANFYALLARLFYSAPDRALLDALAAADDIVAEDDGFPLTLAWRELKLAATSRDAEAVGQEYFRVFVGTGKAEVSPYAGAYVAQSPMANPLVALRGFLAAHGLERRGSAHEPEDHLAALSDVMRHLIARQEENLELQREFFMRFLWPAAPAFCDAASAAAGADFYDAVARFAKCFFELEHAALDMQ